MDLLRTQCMPILRHYLFFDEKCVEPRLNILEVGHVATGTDDGIIPDLVQPLDVLETRQGAV